MQGSCGEELKAWATTLLTHRAQMSGEYIQARGDKVKEVILEQNSKQAPSAKMQLQQNSKQGSTKRFNAIAAELQTPSTLMQLQLQTRVGSMMGKYHW